MERNFPNPRHVADYKENFLPLASWREVGFCYLIIRVRNALAAKRIAMIIVA